MDEIEINILSEDDEEIPYKEPRLIQGHYKKWGNLESAKLIILCDQKVINQIEAHARQSRKEIGGVLIGDYFKFKGITYVHIQEYIGARDKTDNSIAHFNFSPETWAKLNREKDERFDTLHLVGWFHSHPGHGIFLSGQDISIHQNHFDRFWQVALVYDPIRHEGGFFSWNNGKSDGIQPVDGFYEIFLGDGRKSKLDWRNLKYLGKAQITGGSYVLDKNINIEKTVKRNRSNNVINLILLIVVLFLFFIQFIHNNDQFKYYNKNFLQLQSQIEVLEEKSAQLSTKISSVEHMNLSMQQTISGMPEQLIQTVEFHLSPTSTGTCTPTPSKTQRLTSTPRPSFTSSKTEIIFNLPDNHK